MLWVAGFILILILIQIGLSMLHLSDHRRYKSKQQEQFIKDARRIMKGKDIDA